MGSQAELLGKVVEMASVPARAMAGVESLQLWYPHFNGSFTTGACEREGCLLCWGCYCLEAWHKIMGVYALR